MLDMIPFSHYGFSQLHFRGHIIWYWMEFGIGI